MAEIALLQTLIDDRSVARTLTQGTDAKAEVKVLQEVLYALGFGKALSWDRFGPDGDYGNATIKAVKAFAEANDIASDGTKVSADLARLLLKRHAFLDEMHHMQDAVRSPAVLKRLFFKSPDRVAIVVLQTVIFELGYGAEMNWEKWGADGEYGKGTRDAVLAFAARCGIETDGNSVTRDMARASLAEFLRFYGPDWYKETPKKLVQSLTISETSKNVTVSDGVHTKQFRKFRRGVYTTGNCKTATFIDANRPDLKDQGMTDSALNVMLGVSENEGNLDAINTWDNAFMTFGMFQWTIGSGSAKGELPAMFKKIKDADAGLWQEYYGQHGLDIWSGTGAVTGSLTLHGQIINSPAEKEQFRDPRWCFWFWKAGQDPRVQAISLRHAFDRIATFARSPGYQVNGHDVADVVTSEYGMALVLDNHVNRPGYIKACLSQAMNQAGLGGSNPGGWSTADERRLIERYLKIRETYGKSPMTNAAERAKVTLKYLNKGIISAERGSFKT